MSIAQLQFFTAIAHLTHSILERQLRIEADVTAITRETGVAEQSRGFQLLHAQKNARREAGEEFVVARHFQQRTDNRQRQFANLDFITDAHVELVHQAVFNERAFAILESLPAFPRCGFDFAVKWKVAGERTDLREPRPLPFRKQDHRREEDLLGLRRADAVEKRALRIIKLVAGLHHQVGAEQSFGLLFDGAFEIFAE